MPQRGFSLLELMIAVAIFSIVMAIALPSFQSMLDNAKTKAVAESILSGLRLARSEAIKRNAPMRFQLVTTLTVACAYKPVADTTSSFWVVSQTKGVINGANEPNPYGQVAGQCDQAPAMPADPCDATCTNNAYIAYKSEATTRTDTSISVAADAAIVTFGPLGQVLTNLIDGSGTSPASLSQVTVSTLNNDARTWQVLVKAPGGSLKLCNTAIAAGQPAACS